MLEAMKDVRILLLDGDLGAGKTTLTGGIARTLGINEDITSPSFVVNKRYFKDGELKLSHYDFYRLGEDVGIMAEELCEDLVSGAFIVIEWGGEIEDILPEKYGRAKISTQEDGTRKVELR